ncbi:MAG: septum formation initiator family protein [Lachnospiraceae bacterium]|nr:septum formation initiator family protein [Lachnospiraceae bacterium]
MANLNQERIYRNGYTYSPYVDGSAAPVLEPERRRPPVRRKTGKRQATEEGIGKAFAIFLGAMIIMIFASIIVYIKTQYDLTSVQNRIETLEVELNTLRAKNDAAEIRLNKSIDLDEIYRVATEELGMVYPSGEQVVYYSRSDGGYVRQYEDVPKG